MFVEAPYQFKHSIVLKIIFVNILFYLLTSLPIFPNRLIFEKMASIHILISNGEWWRVITSLFIHLDFPHLLINSLTFFLFGQFLEVDLKKFHVFTIYFSSGIIANIFTYFLTPLTYIHVGSSGAVFGVVGTFLLTQIFKVRYKQQIKAIVIIIPLIFFLSLFQENTNILSHITGFIWGLLYGYVLKKI